MKPPREQAKALSNIVQRLRAAVGGLRKVIPRRRNAVRKRAPAKPAACCGGVGTELTKLLAELGIEPKAGCPCKALARQLDRRGPDWCRTHVDEIVAQLSQHVGAYDWREKFLAGVKALPLLAAGQLNPTRPLWSLVLLAIERAKRVGTAEC